MDPYIVVECPQCQNQIQIFRNEINCAIFRHGILKSNGQQMPPHMPKAQCDELASKELIYGCGKPFRLVCNNNTYAAEICDYI